MDVVNVIQKAPDALQAVNEIVSSLQTLAAAIAKFVRIIQGRLEVEAVPVEVVEGEPVKAIPAPDTSGEPASPPPTMDGKPVTKESLRELLVTKDLEAVKKLFGEFGAQKLSGVPEGRYGEFMAKAKMLPNKVS